MSRCPVCESSKIVIALSSKPSAWCDHCGARWTQEGSEQRHIKRGRRSLLALAAA